MRLQIVAEHTYKHTLRCKNVLIGERRLGHIKLVLGRQPLLLKDALAYKSPS
jgi:hypothetical protein